MITEKKLDEILESNNAIPTPSLISFYFHYLKYTDKLAIGYLFDFIKNYIKASKEQRKDLETLFYLAT